MSTNSQIGQTQFGQIQFNGSYDLLEHSDSNRADVNYRGGVGFLTLGSRGYGRPEIFEERILNDTGKQIAEILFTSPSGAILGKLRTDIQKSIISEIGFKINKNGCSIYNLDLNKKPDFPLPNFSIIQIKLFDTKHYWYAGRVEYSDDLIPDEFDKFSLRGVGMREYLKTLGVTDGTVYDAGTDIGEVIDDVVQTWIAPFSPIKYNQSKMYGNIGVVLAGDFEVGSYSIEKILETLQDMAILKKKNFYWSVDGDLEFNFFTVENDSIERTIFIGYDVNKFNPQLNISDVRNSIIVKREQSQGGGAGWTIGGVFNDDSSIAKYGQLDLDYQVPGHFTNDDIDTIGEALLLDKKEPKPSGKVRSLIIKTKNDLLKTGNYRFIFPADKYNNIYNDLDDASQFGKFGTGDLQISDNTDVYIHGSGSVELAYTDAQNDRAELNQNFKGNIKKIMFYIRANKIGNICRVGVGQTNWNENTKDIDIPILSKFFLFTWDVSSLNISEINYFAIQIIDQATTGNSKIYIDKIEFEVFGHQTFKMFLTESNYKFKPNDISIDMEMGNLPPKLETYLAGLFSAASEFKSKGEIK